MGKKVKKSASSKLSILIIAVLAILVMVGVFSVLSTATIPVYIWNSSYQAGSVVNSNMMVPIDIDKSLYTTMHSATGGYGYVSGEELESVVGMYLANDVVVGEPVIKTQLSNYGGTRTEVSLSSGCVGITVPADNVTGVTPNIKPGTFVNIYASFTRSTDGANAQSETILPFQKMKVVDVIYTQVENSSTNAPIIEGVTVEVPLDDSTLLQYACEFGSIRLAIVNGGEYTEKEVAPVSDQTVQGMGNSDALTVGLPGDVVTE